MKTYLWKAPYEAVFSSSSAGEAYSKKEKGTAYISTSEPTIEAVEEKIFRILGNQYRVTSVDNTVYLGVLDSI